MRILMFVANPFTSYPRTYAEAQSLVEAGDGVTVIAWDTEKQNPARQRWDGIDVVRLRACYKPKAGLAWWWLNRLNFLVWQSQAYRQALMLNKETRFDVIQCHDFDPLPISTRLRRKLKIPLVYDAYEIYGYMMVGSLPRWWVKILLWLEKRLIRKVDRIINVCEPQRRYFENITDKPISIIMNCKPLQSLEYEPPNNEQFTLLYVGVLRKTRMLLELVRAAKELWGVRCLIGGFGPLDYVQALKEECSGTSNVAFLGRVPSDQVIPMTKEADCVVLMVSPEDANSRLGLANKQFEAMVCGRPIICTKGTYSGEVTEQEGVGLAVEYSEQALREAIIRLRDDPGLRERLGRNALKAAITKYNWRKEEQKLLELYGNLHI